MIQDTHRLRILHEKLRRENARHTDTVAVIQAEISETVNAIASLSRTGSAVAQPSNEAKADR